MITLEVVAYWIKEKWPDLIVRYVVERPWDPGIYCHYDDRTSYFFSIEFDSHGSDYVRFNASPSRAWADWVKIPLDIADPECFKKLEIQINEACMHLKRRYKIWDEF